MTYSQGSPGYPPAQPPGSYGASAPSFTRTEDGPSKLPSYLSAAVFVLGVATYLASFGPTFKISTQFGEVIGQGVAGPILYTVILAVLAGLLAGVGLLPKGSKFTAAAAAVAVVSALMLIYLLVSKPAGVSIGWALWLVLALTILQAIIAVAALLLESGVISAPAPRPKYEKYDQYSQYGPPPGGYYGQHVPQHQQHGPQQTVGGPRPGYPSQYGGYSSGSSSGGFSAVGPRSSEQGPPTPPTGFPSFRPSPPSAGSGSQRAGAGPQREGPQSQGPGEQQPQSPSSTPSGPSQS